MKQTILITGASTHLVNNAGVGNYGNFIETPLLAATVGHDLNQNSKIKNNFNVN